MSRNLFVLVIGLIAFTLAALTLGAFLLLPSQAEAHGSLGHSSSIDWSNSLYERGDSNVDATFTRIAKK